MQFLYDKFSNDIRHKMFVKNMSYRILAYHLPFSHSTLHRVVKNTRLMDIKTVFILCNLLDLNIFEYIEDEDYQLEMF